jgi:hypothetical protein
MKKSYFLFLICISFSFFSNAQSNVPSAKLDLQPTQASLIHFSSSLKKAKTQKAFRDIIYYEDFDQTSVTNNWTIVDNSGNSAPWAWAAANQAPGGQFSSGTPPINSTTQSNGFMQLRADFYNTPTPSGGFNTMDTYFQSGPIDLRDTNNLTRKAVEISWEQSLRYCCSSFSQLVLEVSTNGINWTAFDARGGIEGNVISPNGQLVRINVSSVLANQQTAYLRFRSSVNTHYYWMIDDLTIFEGPANNLELANPRMTFHLDSNIVLQPQYYQVPLSNVPSIDFEAEVFNGGGNTQTGGTFLVNATSDSLIGGGPGLGLLYSDSNQIGSTGSLAPLATELAENANSFFPRQTSHYTLEFNLNSDSVNQEPLEAEVNRPLSLNDTTIALERGEAFFDGTSGPGGFAASAGVGDNVVALMVVDTAAATVIPSTISYYVPADRAAEIANITISPRIYKFNDSLFASPAGPLTVLDSLIEPFCSPLSVSYTIDTCTSTCPPNQPSIMDTWINLDVSSCPLMTPGTYYFGFEQTAGGGEIWGARDSGAEEQAEIWTNIMFLAGNNGIPPGWGFGDFVIGLRFNGVFPPPRTTAVEEPEALLEEIVFKVYPNPNSGLFTLEMESEKPSTYMLNVRNMLGQTVMSEAINVNGSVSKTMDLTSFEKGVYFVTLENGEDRLVRKVVVK